MLGLHIHLNRQGHIGTGPRHCDLRHLITNIKPDFLSSLNHFKNSIYQGIIIFVLKILKLKF